MGKHGKTEDYNQKPFDPALEPSEKAREFDEQYAQNQSNRKPLVEHKKGRHAK